MPSYAKMLKEILSNQRKIEEDETVNLTEEFSAIIQNKLPLKLKDPGSFSIPCVIGSETIEKAMCDLGASVSLMSLSLCERLGYRVKKPFDRQANDVKKSAAWEATHGLMSFPLFLFCRIIEEKPQKGPSTGSTLNCELSPSFTLLYFLNY